MSTHKGSAVAGMLAIFTIAGCAKGSVKLEDQDKFGTVKSAVWFEWTNDRSGEDSVSHSFVMANTAGLCETMQDAMPEVADAFDGYLEDIGYGSYGSTSTYETYGTYTSSLTSDYEGDTAYYGGPTNTNGNEELCAAYKKYVDRVATALDPMMAKGVNTLTFVLRDPDDDAEDDPPSDDYEAGFDADDPYFTGALAYYDENPYRVIVDEIDCSDSDWYDEGDDAFDDVDVFTIDDGDLVAEEDNDVYKIEMDGDLEDDDGDNAGDIEFRGKFKKCEVEWEGYAYLYDVGSSGYTSSYSDYSDYSEYGSYY